MSLARLQTKARELASAETLALARPISSQTSIAHRITTRNMSVIQLPGSCLSAVVSICTLCHGPHRHHAWQTLIQTPHTRPVEQTKRKHLSVRPHRPSGYIIECGRLACFLRGKFFPLLPACPVCRNLRSQLTMPAARLPGLTLVFPALPYFAHFDVVHVSQRIAGRGSNRVATDPRSWACILPAGECSSVRLWQRPYSSQRARLRRREIRELHQPGRAPGSVPL